MLIYFRDKYYIDFNLQFYFLDCLDYRRVDECEPHVKELENLHENFIKLEPYNTIDLLQLRQARKVIITKTDLILTRS